MCAVHLGVVELERDGKIVPEQLLPVPAPDQKGIVENTAVHSYGTVDFGVDDGRGADDHAGFGQIPVLTAFCHLGSVGEIVPVKLIQISGEQEIAGTDFSVFIFYNGIYGNGIVLYQLISYRKQVEFRDTGGSFANTVIQKHIEFQMLSSADADQVGHIHGFEKGNHGIGCLHPEGKSHGSEPER